MLQCDYHFILDDINVYGYGVSINAIWYTISLFDMLHNFIKLTQKQFVHFYWLFAIIIFALFFLLRLLLWLLLLSHSMIHFRMGFNEMINLIHHDDLLRSAEVIIKWMIKKTKLMSEEVIKQEIFLVRTRISTTFWPFKGWYLHHNIIYDVKWN